MYDDDMACEIRCEQKKLYLPEGELCSVLILLAVINQRQRLVSFLNVFVIISVCVCIKY